MATIDLKQVEKKFGEVHAVRPMDLTINDGEFVVLLGPSGCGKTTTLRMISGLETVTGGRVYLNGKDVTWLAANERDIAFVFQFFALYPHMTVYQNIAFPLESVGESHQVIDQRVNEVVDMLRIRPLLKLKPGTLSGGDKQRVALARSLVRRPACFLMDEPLGALDAEFREAMRSEIKRLHLAQHATTVYVTHDQVEAMAMGDRILVMSNAVVQQVGTPAEVYHDPKNLFVANFIGSPGMQLMEGEYADGIVKMPGGNIYHLPAAWRTAVDREIVQGKIVVGFRPEAAEVAEDAPFTGTVFGTDLHGAYVVLHVTMASDQIVQVRARRDHSYVLDMPVRFGLNEEMVRFFDPKTQNALSREQRA
jgi:multiple sugar transport system ATP-binding protein